MGNVFKLGEKTAEELNLIMEYTSERPIAPDTRDYTMTIPGKHGAWDFGADLEPLPFNLNCATIRKDRSALQQTIRELTAHLFDEYGRPRTMKLIFDYETDKYYLVRYSGSLPISRIVGVGQFTLPLTAFDPLAYSVASNDEILWGSEIIDFSMYYLMGTTGGKTYTIEHPQTIVETVNGTLLRPIFHIQGSASNVTFSANRKSFSLLSFSNSEWIIDGDRWTVLKDGQNALVDMKGNFIDLFPGDNNIKITGDGLNFTLNVRFRDKFL